ncbi:MULTISPECIES: serine/threonine-protein kinase [unclassified Lentimonas]|uniref:serine/threonine protein kinase n=1 Tax=unclassified Lentimonas TaxID=2630993 RepID=UPI0013221D84|nr:MULTISPECIES: serine/threonine-protein kinase [unclassified Lentimonas]CAA6689903.1 Unannotated [Lentimonas sp. CC10]CAA6697126.1 Unannotated [Lentimonas sp. CC19]CAA7069404.1 Unannotated [Lentimonas sp. CC11]
MSAEHTNPTNDAADKALRMMYDLTEQIDSLTEDEINPSFASIVQEVDRYEIIEEIASGGMKQIFKAYDKYTRRHVAMALLAPETPSDRFDPFIHEAWIAAQLDHPNIIKIHDLGITAEKRPFFTMDLKSGQSLQHYIETLEQDTPSSTENVSLDLYIRICDAVAYAHAKGILHLDLKPSNIQISGYGGIVVCDWGLAKIVGEHDLHSPEIEAWDLDEDLKATGTLHGQIKGTPGFMAPEQLAADGDKTPRTDIYALGCILYFLLTQKSPITGTNQEIITRTTDGTLSQTLSLPQTELPPPLRAIIAKATAPQPEDRYKNAEDLVDDIRQYQDGYSPSAEQSSFSQELALFYRRNRTVSNIVLGASLLLMLFTTLFISRIEQSKASEHEARLNAQQALALYDQEHTARHELSKTFSLEKYELSRQLSNEYFYGRPIEAVEQAFSEIETGLSVDPNNELLARQKLYFNFLTLNFKAANEYRENYSGEIKVINDLLQIMEILPSIDSSAQRPPIKAFSDVIQMMAANKEASKRKALIKKMLTYDVATRQDLQGYDQVIKEVLKFFNPEWNTEHFHYNTERKHLALHGEGLHILALAREDEKPSLLCFLPIETLDISDSNIYSLTHLFGLELKELDIRNCLISNLYAIDQFPTLQRLTISPNQFTEEQIDALPESIQVEIR